MFLQQKCRAAKSVCGEKCMRQKYCVAKVFVVKVHAAKVFAAKLPRTLTVISCIAPM